ncbi:MAG: hypothetical protein RR540_00805 [Oscillospiraceae bacterium]
MKNNNVIFDYEKYLSVKDEKNSPKPPQDSPAEPQTAEKATPSAEKIPAGKPQSGKMSRKKRKNSSGYVTKPIDKADAIDSIREAFDNALDEDVSEIAEMSSASEVVTADDKPKFGFKRKLYFAVGIAMTIMSLIGFIFTIVFFAGIISDVANNTKQKSQFVEFIYPVVITDPASFESTAQLSSDTAISAAIWDIILYADKSKYPTEFGTITVPAVDVELHATKLFGKGIVFEHKNLGDAVLSFYYSPETKSYTIPVAPKFFSFSPKVEKISKSGDIYTLKVGYISPSPAWLSNDKAKEPEPDKYMEYVVKIAEDKYTITAINEIAGGHIADGL